MKNTKGITLLALIVTIIILLILAGITISTLMGNGLLKKAKIAKEETNKQTAIEIMYIKIEDIKVKSYMENEEDPSLQYLESELNKDNEIEYVSKESKKNPYVNKTDDNINSIFTKLKKYPYEFEIGENLQIIAIDGIKNIINKENNEGLLGKIQQLNTSGEHTIAVKYKEENEEKTINYNINLNVYNKDLVLDGQTLVEGATLNNNVYEFGDKTKDVATEENYAKNMVVLKVKGNLIINEGVTLTTCKSDDNYGGPKGITIFCDGTIINNGTISMTARGAKAEGENVYLWQNVDGSYEYVPANGALGGDEIIAPGGRGNVAGNNGNNGINRQTGGGGTGSGYTYKQTIKISNGGSGTSYSGGCGSGSATSDGGGSWSVTSGAGSSIGGEGGNGVEGSSNKGPYGYVSVGGTGNPSGIYGEYRQSSLEYKQKNGTGGLLVIYSNEIINNGIIESNGVSSSTSNLTSSSGGVYIGGASGGGSINIFYYNQFLNNGNCTANGGEAINGIGDAATLSGGAGGNGSITFTKLD